MAIYFHDIYEYYEKLIGCADMFKKTHFSSRILQQFMNFTCMKSGENQNNMFL